MKNLSKVKLALFFAYLALTVFSGLANAQELRALTQEETHRLFDRIFQKGALCPEGFEPNGNYPETARCVSFRGYGNCPAIAKGCVEQVLTLQTPARKLFEGAPKQVKYCNCPASFSNW